MTARLYYNGGLSFIKEKGKQLKASKASIEKNAWFVLLMKGDSYGRGCLAIAQSIRNTKTKYPIICICTPDVSEQMCNWLRLVYDKVITIPYITHDTRQYKEGVRADNYNHWVDICFTKWNILKFVEYDKIILVDADMIFIKNCDELFELNAPASCYSIPQAAPWNKNKNSIMNLYMNNGKPVEHGESVRANDILKARYLISFHGGGFLVLLHPDMNMYDKYIKMLNENDIYGANYKSVSNPDEISIAELYARNGINWSHIHQRYAAIPWKKDWVSENIYAYHYLGKKPWDMKEMEWPDLKDWWDVVKDLINKYPQLKQVYYPSKENNYEPINKLVIKIAQYELSNKIIKFIKDNIKDNIKDKNHPTIIFNHFLNLHLTRTILLPQCIVCTSEVNQSNQSDWADIFMRLSTDDSPDIYLKQFINTETIKDLYKQIESAICKAPKSTEPELAMADDILSFNMYGNTISIKTTSIIKHMYKKTNTELTITSILNHLICGDFYIEDKELKISCPNQLTSKDLVELNITHMIDYYPSDIIFEKALNIQWTSLFPDVDMNYGSLEVPFMNYEGFSKEQKWFVFNIDPYMAKISDILSHKSGINFITFSEPGLLKSPYFKKLIDDRFIVLGAIEKIIEKKPRIIVIEGIAGAGKSFVVETLSKYENFYCIDPDLLEFDVFMEHIGDKYFQNKCSQCKVLLNNSRFCSTHELKMCPWANIVRTATEKKINQIINEKLKQGKTVIVGGTPHKLYGNLERYFIEIPELLFPEIYKRVIERQLKKRSKIEDEEQRLLSQGIIPKCIIQSLLMQKFMLGLNPYDTKLEDYIKWYEYKKKRIATYGAIFLSQNEIINRIQQLS